MTAPPPSRRLEDRRALVTMADRYTGPAVIERFEAEGATVIADTDSHRQAEGPQAAIEAAGRVDVLVVNLVARWRPAPPTDTTDEQWLAMFEALVHPTMRFVRAVLPQMIERRSGKIIVVTSAAPLRPTPGSDAYSAGARRAERICAGGRCGRRSSQRSGQCHRSGLRREHRCVPARDLGHRGDAATASARSGATYRRGLGAG